MKALTPTRPGPASPTGTDHYISTYRRSHFRLSGPVYQEMGNPTGVRIRIGTRYAYISPADNMGPKVDRDGKFSSRALHEWLGKPTHKTHYVVTMTKNGARIDRQQPAGGERGD